MRYNIFSLLLSICLLGFGSAKTQDYYTVLIGSFVEASPQDFTAARNLGFVYEQIVEGNIHQVYLGNYTDQAKAATITSALRKQGFTNAQVQLRPLLDVGAEEIVIQIATRYANRSINWSDLKRAGDLNVALENERIKVMTGTFPDLATAKETLPDIRALGFDDAFVKSVARNQLFPVSSLSTGIKEDLIPLQLSEEQTATPPPSVSTRVIPDESSDTGRRIVTNTPTVPRPRVPGAQSSTPSPTTSEPSSTGAPSSAIVTKGTAAPQIRANVKRNSVLNLQRLLQSQGYYKSSLDGLYGNGTTTAYQQMLSQDQNIQKYRLLIPLYTTAINPADPVMSWEEIHLLQAISIDITSDNTPSQTADQERAQLYLRNTPLSIDQGTLLESWQQNRWQKIEQWAASDPFLLETAKSLSFAYFQSLVRLEDFYMDKGFDTVAARHLAIATIKTIAGPQLERF